MCTFEEHLRVDIQLYRRKSLNECIIRDAESLLEMFRQGKLEPYKGQYVVIKDGKIIQNTIDEKSLNFSQLGMCYIRQIVDSQPIYIR